MNTEETRTPVTYVRHRRRKQIGVDINVPTSTVNMVQAELGTSADTESPVSTNVQQEGSMTPLIDVEAFDDDVMISSPRTFAEAKSKNNSKRKRTERVIVDVDSGQSTRFSPYNVFNCRRVPSNQNISRDLIIIAEGSDEPVNVNVRSMPLLPPLPPLPPKEPNFTCPVCMGPFVEEVSTKCGHIFCKKCIRASIAVRGKCPTCRGKISMKNTIRIYLPTFN